MPTAALSIPDTFARLLPSVTQPIELLSDSRPDVEADTHHVFVVRVEGVERLSVDVQLQWVRADPEKCRRLMMASKSMVADTSAGTGTYRANPAHCDQTASQTALPNWRLNELNVECQAHRSGD